MIVVLLTLDMHLLYLKTEITQLGDVRREYSY